MTMTTERAEIERMFDAAEAARDYPGAYFALLARAEAAKAAWESEHADEAREERRQKFLRWASEEMAKARDALSYYVDGDGDSERQEIHDRHVRKAEHYRKQAEAL